MTIAVVGAGATALFTALSLARRLGSRARTLLIGPAPKAENTLGRDLFINALHWRSLAQLGLEGPHEHARVRRIRLALAGMDATISFDEADISDSGETGFGAIIAMSQLRQSLFALARSAPHIDLIECEWEEITIAKGPMQRWTVQAGQPLLPDLLVIADRQLTPPAVSESLGYSEGSYEQTALSGLVELNHSLGNRAWQLFLPTGPLAMLPVAQACMGSFIWTLDKPAAAALLAGGEKSIGQALARQLSERLGSIRLHRLYSPAPLRWQRHRRLCSGRILLIGDAARIIHPMAGIGANLGLYAASRLARALDRPGPQALGCALGQWQRECNHYAQLIHRALAAIRRLSPWLGGEPPLRGLARLGGASMASALSSSAWLRRKVVALAMGPGLARSSLQDVASRKPLDHHQPHQQLGPEPRG